MVGSGGDGERETLEGKKELEVDKADRGCLSDECRHQESRKYQAQSHVRELVKKMEARSDSVAEKKKKRKSSIDVSFELSSFFFHVLTEYLAEYRMNGMDPWIGGTNHPCRPEHRGVSITLRLPLQSWNETENKLNPNNNKYDIEYERFEATRCSLTSAQAATQEHSRVADRLGGFDFLTFLFSSFVTDSHCFSNIGIGQSGTCEALPLCLFSQFLISPFIVSSALTAPIVDRRHRALA